MGHGDFCSCKFWAVSDAGFHLPLARSVMHLSLHCHLCQPLSSGRMLKPEADASLAQKWPKLPQCDLTQPHLHISCSGSRLQGTVLPMGQGTGTQ